MNEGNQYHIILPKPCSGEALVRAIKNAVKEIGGHVEETANKYYAPPGTAKVRPSHVTLEISVGMFLVDEFSTESLDIVKGQYDGVRLFSVSALPKRRLERFSSTLGRHIE